MDYETIEEPVLDKSVIKEHITVQKIISRIHYLKDNVIPSVTTEIDYNTRYNKPNEELNNKLESLYKELEQLEEERKKYD